MSCRSDLAAAIKAAVPAPEAARLYGFPPDRSGFIRCPFHAGDDHGSLKLYPEARGFHCFGCGASGSVIDFVMRLFDVPFWEACARLNADFNLGLSMDRPSRVQVSHAVRKAQAEARKRAEREARELALFDNECRITAAICKAEIAMAEHPPTRSGWETVYPEEWLAAAGELERLRAELYNNDCKQAEMQKEIREQHESIGRLRGVAGSVQSVSGAWA